MAGPTKKQVKSSPPPPERSEVEIPTPVSAAGGGADVPSDADGPVDLLDPVLGHSTRLGPLLRAIWPGSHSTYLSENVQHGLRGAAGFLPEQAMERGGDSRHLGTSEVLSSLAMLSEAMCPWIGYLTKALKARGYGATRERLRDIAVATLQRRVPYDESVILRWDSVRLLHHASTLRRETNGHNEKIGVRHIVWASIFLREGQLALDALGFLERGIAPLVEILAQTVGPEALRQCRYSDEPQAWQAVIERARAQPLLIETRKPRSGFEPDVVSDPDGRDAIDSDPLGTKADATALADLILLEAAKPPLAIGLFGSWGSGKSTLIRRLKEEIQRQTDEEKKCPWIPVKSKDEAKVARVRNVVQLDFNAWSFMDSENLWASLTSEIFEQLQAGGGERWAKDAGRRIVTEVAGKAAAKQSEAVSASDEAARKEAVLVAAEATLREVKDNARTARETALTELLTDSNVPFPEAISAALVDRGVARGWLGRLRSSLAAWRAAEPRRILLAAGLVSAALLAATLFAVDAVRQAATSFGLVALAATGAAVPVMRPLLPILRTVGAYDKARRQSEAGLKAETRRLNDAVESARAERDIAVAAQADQSSAAAALAETAAEPAKLLSYLLSESTDIETVRSKLGLLAAVRRCFQSLESVIASHAKSKDSIHRIVLYVDDLDRCSADRVVEVLEAVHLLLAFQCFVVVVAIDARWLHRSLQVSHPQFRTEETDRAKPAPAADDLPSPSDYLEKIFQIPFWVRQLEAAPAESPEDPAPSPYVRYLNTLLGERSSSDGSSDAGPAHPDGDGAGQASAPLIGEPPKADPDADEGRARIERVALTDAERDLLDALGPLAARSPRAIKRLVNVYRVIKAGVPESRITDFEGKGGGASFASILFLLAIDAALTAGAADAVKEAIGSFSPVAWSRLVAEPAHLDRADLSTLAENRDGRAFRALVERLRAAKRVRGFITALEALRDWDPAASTQAAIEHAAKVTQRFSFRAP